MHLRLGQIREKTLNMRGVSEKSQNVPNLTQTHIWSAFFFKHCLCMAPHKSVHRCTAFTKCQLHYTSLHFSLHIGSRWMQFIGHAHNQPTGLLNLPLQKLALLAHNIPCPLQIPECAITQLNVQGSYSGQRAVKLMNCCCELTLRLQKFS